MGSAGRLNDDGSHLYRRMQGYDTSGIAFVGAYGEPDAEAVAALAPDLIIATPFDDLSVFSAIAPTIAIDVHGQPLDVGLRQFADAVNRLPEAEAVAGPMTRGWPRCRGCSLPCWTGDGDDYRL